MIESWRTLRIFVSSTFRDMQAERDYLGKVVFPALRARLEPHRIHLVDIDLRWGLTKDQAANNEVLQLCLQTLDRCHFFVGLLGSRYGTAAESLDPEMREQIPWLANEADASITELEMLYGVLRGGRFRSRSAFYFRDPRVLTTLPRELRDVLEETAHADEIERWGAERAEELREIRQQRLEQLKERLIASDVHVVPSYASEFAGLRIRWGLAKMQLEPEERSILHALARDGLIDMDEYRQLEEHPHLQEFVRQYGTIALNGLEEFGRGVYSDLWELFCGAPELDGLRDADLEMQQSRPSAPVETRDRRLKSLFISLAKAKGFDFSELMDVDEDEFDRTMTGALLAADGTQRRLIQDMFEEAQVLAERENALEQGGVFGAGSEDLDRERDHHLRFLESRLRVYVRRRAVERLALDYVRGGSNVPLVVVGESGSGKSALLARTALVCGRLLASRPQTTMVTHFVGASPRSTSLAALLQRICTELAVAVGDREPLSNDLQELTKKFSELTAALPSDRHVLLVIDALNQLDEGDLGHALDWLPRTLPPTMKIIVSCIADEAREGRDPILSALRFRQHQVLDLREHPLTKAERRRIIDIVPSLASKTLDEDQVELLLDNPATAQPLYLLVALEELRNFGSFELLTERIRLFSTAADATELFGQVIEWTEYDFDEQIVEQTLSAIVGSRFGMSESELRDDVAMGIDDPAEQKSRQRELEGVLRHLRSYLLRRGPFVDCYHRTFYKAIATRYLDAEALETTHRRLADTFRQRACPEGQESWSGDRRALNEIVHHLVQGRCWDAIEELLQDDGFLAQKVRGDLIDQVSHDFAQVLIEAPLDKARQAAKILAQKTAASHRFSDVLVECLLQVAGENEQRVVDVAESMSISDERLRNALMTANSRLIAAGFRKPADAVLNAVHAALGDDEQSSSQRITLLNNRAVMLSNEARFEEAVQVAEEGLALVRQREDAINLPILLTTLFSAYARWGRLEEAERIGLEALEASRGVMERYIPRVAIFMAEVYGGLGRLDESRALLEEGLTLARRYQYWSELLRISWCLSQIESHHGRPRKAAEWLEQALNEAGQYVSKQESIFEIMYLARYYADDGDLQRARSLIEDEINHPEAQLPTTYDNYARVLKQMREYDAAVEAVAKGIALTDADGFRHLAGTLLDTLFECALQARNLQWFAQAMNQMEQHIELMERAGIVTQTDFLRTVSKYAQYLYFEIDAKAKDGDFERAEELVRRGDELLRRYNPNDVMVPILTSRWAVLLAMQDCEAEAEQKAELAVEQIAAQPANGDPGVCAAHLNLSVLAAERADPEQEVEHLANAVDVMRSAGPGQWESQWLDESARLASKYRTVGRPDTAGETLDALVAELNSRYREDAGRRATLLYQGGKKALGEGLPLEARFLLGHTWDALQQVSGIEDGVLSQIQLQFASALHQAGEFEVSLQQLEECRRRVVESGPAVLLPEVHFWTARTYLEMDRLDEAIASCRQGMEAIPEELEGREGVVANGCCFLGEIELRRGNTAEARNALDEAIEIDGRTLGEDSPNAATAWALRAMVSLHEGNAEEAEPLLERALHVQRKGLSVDHPRVALSHFRMAQVQAELNNGDGAERHVGEALRIQRARLGAEHPLTLRTLEWQDTHRQGT